MLSDEIKANIPKITVAKYVDLIEASSSSQQCFNMAAADSFLHLTRPLGPASLLAPPSTTPLSISLHPQALFSILDHSQRRPPAAPRVIGTLLGSRSEDGTVVSITSSFAVGHTETTDQVEVDMEYQKQMLALHLRAKDRKSVV